MSSSGVPAQFNGGQPAEDVIHSDPQMQGLPSHLSASIVMRGYSDVTVRLFRKPGALAFFVLSPHENRLESRYSAPIKGPGPAFAW